MKDQTKIKFPKKKPTWWKDLYTSEKTRSGQEDRPPKKKSGSQNDKREKNEADRSNGKDKREKNEADRSNRKAGSRD